MIESESVSESAGESESESESENEDSLCLAGPGLHCVYDVVPVSSGSRGVGLGWEGLRGQNLTTQSRQKLIVVVGF